MVDIPKPGTEAAAFLAAKQRGPSVNTAPTQQGFVPLGRVPDTPRGGFRALTSPFAGGFATVSSPLARDANAAGRDVTNLQPQRRNPETNPATRGQNAGGGALDIAADHGIDTPGPTGAGKIFVLQASNGGQGNTAQPDGANEEVSDASLAVTPAADKTPTLTGDAGVVGVRRMPERRYTTEILHDAEKETEETVKADLLRKMGPVDLGNEDWDILIPTSVEVVEEIIANGGHLPSMNEGGYQTVFLREHLYNNARNQGREDPIYNVPMELARKIAQEHSVLSDLGLPFDLPSSNPSLWAAISTLDKGRLEELDIHPQLVINAWDNSTRCYGVLVAIKSSEGEDDPLKPISYKEITGITGLSSDKPVLATILSSESHEPASDQGYFFDGHRITHDELPTFGPVTEKYEASQEAGSFSDSGSSFSDKEPPRRPPYIEDVVVQEGLL